MIAVFKHLHMTFALLSFVGFFLRGVWMLQNSGLLRRKWAKVVPHIVDTFLLATAIVLAVMLSYSPGDHPWLMTKIIALFVYIGIGVLAFRHPIKKVRIIAWLAALVVFLYIVSVALAKHPMGFFLSLTQ